MTEWKNKCNNIDIKYRIAVFNLCFLNNFSQFLIKFMFLGFIVAKKQVYLIYINRYAKLVSCYG